MDDYLVQLDARLAQLRSEWVANPGKRKIIECQGKLLKWAKELYLKKQETDLYEQAKIIFGEGK